MLVGAFGAGTLGSADWCEDVTEAKESGNLCGNVCCEVAALVCGQRFEGVVPGDVVNDGFDVGVLCLVLRQVEGRKFIKLIHSCDDIVDFIAEVEWTEPVHTDLLARRGGGDCLAFGVWRVAWTIGG